MPNTNNQEEMTISTDGEEELDGFISEAWMTVTRLMKRIRHGGQGVSDEHDLTGTQLFALWQIREGGPMTMGELSEVLAVTHGVATRMVDRLCDKGMLTRTRDEADRRVVRVSLSELGEEVSAGAIDAAIGIFRDVFRSVPQSDREEYLSLLKRIEQAQEGTQQRAGDSQMEVSS